MPWFSFAMVLLCHGSRLCSRMTAQPGYCGHMASASMVCRERMWQPGLHRWFFEMISSNGWVMFRGLLNRTFHHPMAAQLADSPCLLGWYGLIVHCRHRARSSTAAICGQRPWKWSGRNMQLTLRTSTIPVKGAPTELAWGYHDHQVWQHIIYIYSTYIIAYYDNVFSKTTSVI